MICLTRVIIHTVILTSATAVDKVQICRIEISRAFNSSERRPTRTIVPDGSWLVPGPATRSWNTAENVAWIALELEWKHTTVRIPAAMKAHKLVYIQQSEFRYRFPMHYFTRIMKIQATAASALVARPQVAEQKDQIRQVKNNWMKRAANQKNISYYLSKVLWYG